MKKFGIKYLTLGFIILMIGVLGVFSFNQKEQANAEDAPSYFTVIQYSNYDSQEPENNVAYASLKNGDTAYVRFGHVVKAQLKLPVDSDMTIKHITPYITFNKKTYLNTELYNRGIIVDYSNQSFSLITYTSSEEYDPYGRYDLSINYIIEENGVDNNKSFTFTYFVVPELDYYNGENVQSTFNLSTSHLVSTDSAVYDRVYIYQYQQNNSNQLPTLTFNKKNFKLTISKTFQKGTFVENIWFNGTNIETDNNLVYIKENPNNNNVTIYFNDLGLYEIGYTFTYSYDDNIDVLLPISGISSTSLNYIKRVDALEICGYQAYYSDINSGTLKEFKNLQDGIIGQEITDITFLSENRFNQSLGEFTTEETANIQVAENLLEAFVDAGYSISSTNQAPVQFVYNVELYNNEKTANKIAQSKYWKVNYDYSLYTGSGSTPISYDYDNSPFTQNGIYLLKVVYENHSLVSSSGIDSKCETTKISGDGISDAHLRCQWFLFKITRDTTQMKITEDTEEGKSLFDGEYTNKTVAITKETSENFSMFDAVTELRVYRQPSYSGQEVYVGTVERDQVFVDEEHDNRFKVTENGRYRVVMMFGKNLTRSYSSTFIIDKNPIENIQISTLNKLDSDYYVKDRDIEFLTNQPVMVSWNEKDSGSTTRAEYKYIPLVKDTEMEYTASVIEYLYMYGAVPVQYMFDNQNTQLRSIAYANNMASDYVMSTNVLTQAGMYIFHITDTAGNEKYFAFIIDNTENKILQKVDGVFVEPEGLNILSSDVTIAWGNHKIIKFNNLKRIYGKVVDADDWLCEILNNTDVFTNYFEMLSVHTVNTYYTKTPILDTVWYSIGGDKHFALTGTDHIDIEFLINDENNNLVANELQYIFYTRDAANTKVLAGYQENSFDNYESNYSSSHSVILSSDASRTVITYSQNDTTKSLVQEAYSSTAENQKNKYYTPTTKAMLANSNEVINLTFNPTPESGVLEIQEVKYVYSAFSKTGYDSNGRIVSYGYKFDTPEDEVIIYSRTDSSQNLALQNADGTYSWEVKKEYVYNPNDPISYKTREGKYTITRIYASLSNTQSKLEESYDYMVRTFTFIVDRNGIISSPSVVDEAGTMFSYVGESIKLEVLESTNEGTMFFKDVYIASNDISENRPILTTNKLPVFVFIPVVKYGYSLGDGLIYNKEHSINSWEQGLKVQASEIKSYSLSAQIRYSSDLSGLNQSTEIYTNNLDPTDGYLRFDGNMSQSGRAFTKVGYYKVTITQGYKGYGANTFNFIFQITQTEPNFTVTDTVNNEELNNANNIYYTNKDSIRLTWTDSDNEFEAKINTKAIFYSVNDTDPVNISEDLISTNGNNHFVDLNLKTIGAYANGSKVTINMQFEGDEKDYNNGYFRASKTVVVDTVAPTANISKLIDLYGLDASFVRNYGIGFNTSVSSGIYRYFAYAIDRSQLSRVLDLNSYTNGEAYTILYRIFETENGENTKYNDIYTQETLPSTIESSTNGFEILDSRTLQELAQNRTLTYIEVVERDMAGNITIYTIYITDYQAMIDTNVTPITYTTSDNQKSLFYADLKTNINMFAKNNFNLDNINLFNYAWNKITVNGVTYLKTPYSDGKYYNLKTYNPTNISESQVELNEITRFLSSSQKQNIVISFVPYFNTMTFSCSVLNSSLSVLHTSQTSNFVTEEGLMIKVPTNTTASDASIYATYVEIVHYVLNPDGMTYTQEKLYKKEDLVYFSSNDKVLDNTSLISSVYVNYMGSTYLKITVNEPQKDRFYKYFVKDNFLDEYSFTNIYGSQAIEKQLYSDVDLVENYENGIRYYYSTKDITYVFNYKKDKVILALSITPKTFVIAYAHTDVTDFKNLGYGNVSFNGDLCTVVMYAPKQDMANGIVGGERTFTIRVYEAIAEISNGLPYNTIHLDIYNIIPNISLVDNYNNSQNALFSKDTMYGNELRINFRQTTGKISCQIYLESEDGTIEQITSGKLVSLPGQYSIIVRFTEIFTNRQYDMYLEFIISDNDEDFYQIKYKSEDNVYLLANPTGNSFSYMENTITYTIATHYILNTSEFEIICNTDQDISARDVETIRNGSYVTYIYEISNIASTSASKYFTRNVAITVIPKTNTILTNYSYYTNEGTRTPFDLTKTQESFVVSTEESNSSYKRLTWQSYYGIPENKVNVKIFFGDNQTVYTPVTTVENNYTTITLKSSGIYYLTFSDMAGNVHMFNQLVSTYTIRYLRSVIYNVNGESPINNAVYDSQVEITIPASTIKYYDSNAQPVISVLKNGEEYIPEYTRTTRTYLFTEAGLYKVWFSAAVTENGVIKNINEQPLYFLIIKPRESRSAFEISEYADYYVEQILKDGVDITKSITNENMGKLVYKTIQDENGVYVDKAYLKSLLISVNDAVTGAGNYTITINTNNEFGQTYTFDFWINNKQAPINVSIPENSSTTSTIVVSFNTTDLIEDVGDCILKITGYEDFHMSSQALADGNLSKSYNIKITTKGAHFIQLYSESGKLLYSYKVIKNEPLNAISIIVIVVSSILVVVGVFVFIRLRKRMKVR